MVAFAANNWDALDGFAVSQNMPPLDLLPLNRFFNFVWWWATRQATSQADIDRFKIKLWTPPKGVEPTSGPWSVESEVAALKAFKSSLGNLGG